MPTNFKFSKIISSFLCFMYNVHIWVIAVVALTIGCHQRISFDNVEHTLLWYESQTSRTQFIVLFGINYSILHLDFIKHPICRSCFHRTNFRTCKPSCWEFGLGQIYFKLKKIAQPKDADSYILTAALLSERGNVAEQKNLKNPNRRSTHTH